MDDGEITDAIEKTRAAKSAYQQVAREHSDAVNRVEELENVLRQARAHCIDAERALLRLVEHDEPLAQVL